MKKALLCILTLSVLLGALSACGRKNGVVTTTPSPVVTAPLDGTEDRAPEYDQKEDGNRENRGDVTPAVQSPKPEAIPKGADENIVTP